ncbi:MarR family transcriptional regulator [Natrinema salifodinae]|uniref:Sugar-specific transcriptional regulator TrmB n=1 Tax=Natrinema salifodinae TaxID=1202768 RepID=A0A1I0QAM0_9EURY|nr:MarR family transcriptional regulator [Natrinema salifodinae]SEW24061.1 hypothetical protein SAMN05216285_3310 [Natrinema salifodinae]
MVMKPNRDVDQIERLPTELSSDQAKLVFLYLAATDGATPTDLQYALRLRKLAILSVLQSLSSEGLVERTDAGYVTTDIDQASDASTGPISA